MEVFCQYKYRKSSFLGAPPLKSSCARGGGQNRQHLNYVINRSSLTCRKVIWSIRQYSRRLNFGTEIIFPRIPCPVQCPETQPFNMLAKLEYYGSLDVELMNDVGGWIFHFSLIWSSLLTRASKAQSKHAFPRSEPSTATGERIHLMHAFFSDTKRGIFARRAYCVGTLKNPCVCVRSFVRSFVRSSAALLDRFWSMKMEIPGVKRWERDPKKG